MMTLELIKEVVTANFDNTQHITDLTHIALRSSSEQSAYNTCVVVKETGT